MNEIFLKKTDVLPVLQTIVSGENGVLDLSNFTGVNFAYRQRYTGVATVSSGRIVNASAGVVEFQWTTNVTSTPGVYFGEWRLLGVSGQRSYPQSNYINFEIISGLI